VNKFLRETLPQWNEKLRGWNAPTLTTRSRWSFKKSFTQRRKGSKAAKKKVKGRKGAKRRITFFFAPLLSLRLCVKNS
jgi:hypothetical protein